MELLIETENRKADRRLRALEKRLGGSTEMMSAVAVVIAENNKKGFERVKQQPATIEWKQKYGLSQEPLVETGRMRRELTTEAGIKLITPTQLDFGSTSKVERGKQMPMAKAWALQHGTKHQQRHRVLRATPTSRREIQGIIMDFITRD
jgi:hypothetical protein